MFLLLFSVVFTVNGIINDCPSGQEYDTHLTCQIFRNTNINEIFSSYNFSENNYCGWSTSSGDDYIQCSNGVDIIKLQLDYINLEGTLNLTYPWPPNINSIDLDNNEVKLFYIF